MRYIDFLLPVSLLSWHLNSRKPISRGAIAVCFFLLIASSTSAQVCDCPIPGTCEPCAGGLISITLRYDGAASATITATDDSGVIFDGVVAPEGTFTLTGSKPDGKFEGPHIDFTVDGIEDARIKTNCEVVLYRAYESFTVTGASSKDGGPLCCAPADVDDTPPVIADCPADMEVALPADQCSAVVNWIAPTATDDCEIDSFTSDIAPGTSLQAGTHTVTYTAKDKRGNTAVCTFDIIVSDETLPVFTGCPADISVPAGLLCQAVVTWSPPGVSDNCPGVNVQSSHLPLGVFPSGTTTVTYTATDAAGNVATCSFKVTVVDEDPPVIALCPNDITVNAGSGCQATVSWIPPTYVDLCPVTFTSNRQPGDRFSVGTTTVTYTAKDQAGNISTCSFDVTVKDETAPVITNCPGDIAVNATNLCGAVVSWTVPTTTDACPVALAASHNPGSTFPIGTTTVTYTAKDPQNNTATCSFKVTVTDNTKPVITGCPANITKSATSACQAIVTWTPPTATDNCAVTLTSSHAPGSGFLIGTTTVTYTARDANGNTSTCAFDITVTDNNNPTFVGCPDDIVVTATSSCQAPVSWTPPSSSDSCPVTFTSTHQPGSNFPIGVTTVTYTATDSQGNTSTCNFSITVNDSSSPTITGCPSNITASASGTCQAVVSWTPPTANDNCTVTLTSTRAPGSTFPIGSTTVTYTATDPGGKTATCSFNVVVEDTTSPSFNGCVSDVVVTSTGCETKVSWTAPLASDNCSVTVTASHAPGSMFPSGTTPVTYTATDAKGNKSTCTFNVIVNNGPAPVITGCPTDITLRSMTDGAIASWTEPTATTQCGDVTKDQSHQSGQTFPVGTTEVVYTFTDDAGNATACSFNVIVESDVVAVTPGKALTPDGDGYNDTWWITDIERFANNSVIVVDRWGNKIFQTTGYNNERNFWNGNTLSGARVPTGTYFFTIDIRTDRETVRQKGFIEVIQ